MKTILGLISHTCEQLVGWFDKSLQQILNAVTQIANVAIRVFLAYALYALFVEDLLLNIADKF